MAEVEEAVQVEKVEIPEEIRKRAEAEYRKAYNRAFKAARTLRKKGEEPEVAPKTTAMEAKKKVLAEAGY
jgi:hypothetical protein